MRVGYGRISTDKETQKFDRQEDQLREAGCEKIYLERMTGRKSERPELNKMLSDLLESKDDKKQVVCVSLDRLGRSTKNVLDLVDVFKENKIELISLKEGSLIDESPQSKFFLTILSAFAELEADMCSERVKDGLRSAQKRGKKLGRPKKDMDIAVRMWESREYSISEICEANKCCKQTLYNELRKRELM